MYLYFILLFASQGYEFDVGIHYVGGMNGTTLTRTLSDQITEGRRHA